MTDNASYQNGMLSEPKILTENADSSIKQFSPGRLARPLKKKKYQQSEVYNQNPGDKQKDESISQPVMSEPPLDVGYEPIDSQFSPYNKKYED